MYLFGVMKRTKWPDSEDHSGSVNDNYRSARQQWLRILACAKPDELASAISSISPQPALLRPPEIGLAMVAGRVGATGSPFGLGEMTLTRCVVQIGDAMGVGYVRGRAPDHARRVAVADALLQGPRHDEIFKSVVAPLVEAQRRRNDEAAAAIETSRVQFLTMVRGD